MNHDATHCADYKTSCPRSCYRGELVRDLRRRFYPLPVSWAHLEGTEYCQKEDKTNDRQRKAD